MKTIKNITFIALLAFALSCVNKEEIDTEKPVIHTDYSEAFPSYCDTLYFGEDFFFKAYFSDNFELGAYSIDIHNNFNHHSHGHRIDECDLAPKKDPINPILYLEVYEIPQGSKEYTENVTITIPAQNNSGLYDEGEYHFQIILTDKEGWSTTLGLSVKLLHRN